MLFTDAAKPVIPILQLQRVNWVKLSRCSGQAGGEMTLLFKEFLMLQG